MQCPPVIFIAFNRPDVTQQVFSRIRDAKPGKLFLVQDGPRASVPEDKDKCIAVRKILDGVDWECEVHRIFSEENLGCEIRVASGISEAFSKVDRAIILEDDCLPHSDFFKFCGVLLENFKDDERVMHVSGTCFPGDQERQRDSSETAYFSKYPFMWGWATWQRAWKHYDREMIVWRTPVLRDAILKAMDSDLEREQWTYRYNSLLNGQISTWDWQWQLSVWAQNGLTVAPRKNLITNIGFRDDATHTKSEQSWQSVPCTNLPVVVVPQYMIRDLEADTNQFRNFMCARPEPVTRSPLHRRLATACKSLMRRTLGKISKFQ